MAARIAHHISGCTDCMQTKRTDKRSITPPMIDTSKLALGPEDALHMDIVPFDEPSGGYNAIITAIVVFSRYLFTYNVVKTDAPTVARVLVDIMTRHAYLPTTVITDKGTQFLSEVMADATRTLCIQLKHATTKHAQTIGIPERSHASLKESLKISTGERRTMWHQYVAIATLNYNTSYHSALGCEPSRVFYGRIPYNVLDLKFGIRNERQMTATTNLGEDILHKTQIKVTVSKNLMQSYIRYKQYYVKKQMLTPSTSTNTATHFTPERSPRAPNCHSRNTSGQDPTSSSKCFPTTITLSENYRRIIRKSFTESDENQARPKNHFRKNTSCPKIKVPTRK